MIKSRTLLPALICLLGAAGLAIAQSGGVSTGRVTTAAPTYTTGTTAPISLATTGSQRVEVTSGTITSIGTSVVPGTGATNLGKAEDAVAATGNTGVGVLAVQDPSPADDAADGDWAWLQMDNGRLWTSTILTDGTDTALIDGSGNLSIVCSNCSGSGASDIDDSTFTAGTDVGAPIGGVVTTDDVDAGDFGIAAMTDDRALHTIIRNEDGTERTTWAVTQSGTWDEVGINDSGNSITVDGTVTVTDGSGALNVIVDSITAGNNNIGDVDVASIAAGNNNIGDVDVASSNSASTQAAALPAAATSIGYRSDQGLAAGTAGNTTPIVCQDSVAISTAASANTQLVALTASETIYVCGYNFIAAGTVEVQLITGTGTACATGETDLTGAYPLTAQAGMVVQNPYPVTKGLASNALCIELSAAVQVSGMINYTKF